MTRLRSRAFGFGLAALIGGLSHGAGPAWAATATLRGSELSPGFGRMLFEFDNPPKVTARVANGVLIIGFGEPVTVAVDRLARELPNYLSVVRVDPDGRGMRLALLKPHRVNLIEAGEKVFVDIIPENWQGLLPSLPQSVIEDLARRVKTAEVQARIVQSRRENEELKSLNVRSAVLPTLHRLIFETASTTPIEFKTVDGRVDVLFDQPLKLDPAAVRPLLPPGASIGDLEMVAGTLRFSITPPEGWQPKAFREDEGLVIDLARPVEKNSPETVVTLPDRPQPESRQSEVQPAAPKPAEAGQARIETAPAPAPRNTAESQAAGAGAEAAGIGAASGKPALVARDGKANDAGTGRDAQPRLDLAGGPQPVAISARTENDTTRVDFAFPRGTAAAAYERGGVVTLVFDTRDILDPAKFAAAVGALASESSIERQGMATVARLTPRQRQIMRLAAEGNTWSLTLGEAGLAAAQTLLPRRSSDENGRTIVSVALPDVSSVHWIDTDGRGEPVAVATAFGQAKAIGKPQRFVDFTLPQTAHGLAVVATADDLIVRASAGEVSIGKTSGLAISTTAAAATTAEADSKQTLLVRKADWDAMRAGSVREKARDMVTRVLNAPAREKNAARLDYADFLLANELASEALGPINAVTADDTAMRTNRRLLLLKGMAQSLLHRDKEAEATLSASALKDDAEAALWRALGDARQQNHPKAFVGFRRASDIIDAYPEYLQAVFRPQVVRSGIAMRDFAVAEQELQILQGLPGELTRHDELLLLRAMIDEATGRADVALGEYKTLFSSSYRPVAAEAQLRGVALSQRQQDKTISEEEAVSRLETLAVTWRGGQSEIATLGALGRIYADKMRWRDAFAIAKLADQVFPDHPITRQMHDETAAQFEELFTSGRADTLPRVEALALFYDFKEFLPIGRRGDEIVRKLSDRLVELDLLDQGADLLQHQMEHRLNGAARATVAARLAMVRLMAGKPADALAAIQTTRLPELPMDVRRARLLLEAKALSDLSRTDLALEILTAERGAEIDRLRADILWSGRRWREAGEAHERILGTRWRQNAPLTDRERADVMRAGVAYVMADEALSLDRLRAKFAAKMADSVDARTFAFVTGADKLKSADVRELARSAASADTMTEFLEEYRKRYPGYASALRPKGGEAESAGEATEEPKGGAPAPKVQSEADAKAPAGARS